MKIGMCNDNYIDQYKTIYIPNREATIEFAKLINLYESRLSQANYISYEMSAYAILYAEIAHLQTEIATLAEANSGIPDWARQVNELLAENEDLKKENRELALRVAKLEWKLDDE